MDCVDHSAKASGVICYRNKMKIHLTIAIGFIVRHAGRSARCGTCCSEAAVSSFLHTRTPHHHQSSLRTPFLIMRDKIEALVRFPLEDLEGLDLSPFVPAGSGAVYSRRTDDWPPLAQLRRPHGHPCGRQHMYAAVRLIFSSTGAVAVASCAATRSNRMNESLQLYSSEFLRVNKKNSHSHTTRTASQAEARCCTGRDPTVQQRGGVASRARCGVGRARLRECADGVRRWPREPIASTVANRPACAATLLQSAACVCECVCLSVCLCACVCACVGVCVGER